MLRVVFLPLLLLLAWVPVGALGCGGDAEMQPPIADAQDEPDADALDEERQTGDADSDPESDASSGAPADEDADATSDVAYYADTLVIDPDPAAVVVFAGTNDVAASVPADVVVERIRCLRNRVGEALGWERPVLFVGITPAPSRWGTWSEAARVNAAIERLAIDDPGLQYVDTPAVLLSTGEPPAASLFVSDQLHLSDSGYALWGELVASAVSTIWPEPAPRELPTLMSGTRILVDLGADDGVNGERTPSPDYLGQHWNNWHSQVGGGELLPGERLTRLVDSDGLPTMVSMEITGGFFVNGWRNGGLRWPEQELLRQLAVGSATGDFAYFLPEDMTGGFVIRGLSPDTSCTFRMFSGRSDTEVRETTVLIAGDGTSQREASVQTSGAGAGAGGGEGNDAVVTTLQNLRPDAWGNLFVDLQVTRGSYGYVNCMELIVEESL